MNAQAGTEYKILILGYFIIFMQLDICGIFFLLKMILFLAESELHITLLCVTDVVCLLCVVNVFYWVVYSQVSSNVLLHAAAALVKQIQN